MKVSLECKYCGFRDVKETNSQVALDSASCLKCGDTSLIIRNYADTRVDAYKGSPPFPEKPKKKVEEATKPPVKESPKELPRLLKTDYDDPWWSFD